MAKPAAPKGGPAGTMIKGADGAKGPKAGAPTGKDAMPPPSNTKKK
jgi:hypothetical protein